jgi:hypothetical protein
MDKVVKMDYRPDAYPPGRDIKMADDRNTCDHRGCNCAAGKDSDYCSPYCESAGETDTTEIACDCGHSGCTGTQLTT